MTTAPDLAPPADRASTSPFVARYRATTLGMVALIALSAFESLAVTTTMPTVVEALGGISLYAMAFAGPMASSVVGMVGAGSWADRRGPARPLLTGVGLFVLGLLVAGVAPQMGVLVAGRVVQGLGSGMLIVALYVVVARVYPVRVRPRVFAAFAAAWVLPAVVGPAIAGLVAQHLGWRWVFLSVPVLALPALLAVRPALRGTTGPADDGVLRVPDRPRLVRAVGAGTGALLLHWAGQQTGATAVGAVVVGLGLLVVSVPGLLPRGTYRAARGLPAVIVVRGLIGAAFFGAEVYLPLLLTTERGLSPAQAGLALTGAAVLWSTGSWLRGRSDDRWDDATVLRLGALAITVGIAAIAVALVPAVPVAVSLVGWGAAGLGMGLAYPTLSLLTLALAPPAEHGTASSALQVNEALSIALVLAVSGPLFATLLTVAVPLAYLATLGVATAAALVAAVVAGRVTVRA